MIRNFQLEQRLEYLAGAPTQYFISALPLAEGQAQANLPQMLLQLSFVEPHIDGRMFLISTEISLE